MTPSTTGKILRCILFLACFWTVSAQTSSEKASQPGQRILILISLDGFRWDYLERYKPPTLLRLAEEGVRAERMIPSFPSVTFPNHYTLVTGLRPEHHGVVNNSMFDPVFQAFFSSSGSIGVREGRWWGGEPIWVTAIKQGRRSACMFWPGSEAEIGGFRPTYWSTYDGKVTDEERVDTVLKWLDLPAATRPSAVTLYFNDTDAAAHKHGTTSPELKAAVQHLDECVERLVTGLRDRKLEREVQLVIVSDHGMADLSVDRTITIDDFVSIDSVQVEWTGAVAGLRPKTESAKDVIMRFGDKPAHFRAYLRENIPEELHLRDSARIPPIVLIADEGWYIDTRASLTVKKANFESATHGFDPALISMGATFIAWGSAFRHHEVIPPFENIYVYNLLCATLGLTPAKNDGDDRLSRAVLNSP